MIEKHLRALATRIIELLWKLIKPKKRVLVFGSPSTEGNALVVAKKLTQKTGLDVTWINAPPAKFLEHQGFELGGRLELLGSTRELKAIWRFLTSKYIFTTTELYGMPSPSSNRILVNLWHGEGIKSGKFFPNRTAHGPSSTYLVGSTHLLAESRAKSAGVPLSSVLFTGMPRVDLFSEPSTDGDLIELGIDPELPFILLMPTFRRAKTKSGKLWWSDTSSTYTTEPFTRAFSKDLGDSLSRLGMQIVVKPHYLDFDNLNLAAFTTVTDENLISANSNLYGLMARSSALISDYSSVWLDYLHLDKPIAFFAPDASEFWGNRQMDQNFLNLQLPGLEVRNSVEIFEFCRDVANGADTSSSLRELAKRELGLISFPSNTEELLRAISILR
jgi:hypothetical protein